MKYLNRYIYLRSAIERLALRSEELPEGEINGYLCHAIAAIDKIVAAERASRTQAGMHHNAGARWSDKRRAEPTGDEKHLNGGVTQTGRKSDHTMGIIEKLGKQGI